jgi:hypothetical protein
VLKQRRQKRENLIKELKEGVEDESRMLPASCGVAQETIKKIQSQFNSMIFSFQ